MKLLKKQQLKLVLLGVALACIPLLASAGIVPTSYTTVFAGIIIYGIAALGLNILLGYSGLISLGTAGFMGLAAYISAYVTEQLHLPFEIGFLLAVLIPTLLGILVGLISLKIEGLYLAIATLAVAEILREIFIQFDFFTGGASGASASYPTLFFGLVKLDKNMTYIFICVVLVIMMLIMYNLMKGYIGRALNTMRGSEHAAQAMGINLFKYRLIAFALATAFAAVAGVLYVHIIRLSYPTVWSLTTSLDILGAVVIGGFRSIPGTLFGSFIIYGMSELFLKQVPFLADYAYVIKGVLIILVVMYFPGGAKQLGNWILSKIRKVTRKGKVNKDESTSIE